ncbi:hypothetical protein COE65_25005 [Bacillus sp. AFS051223]|uniref:DUF3883 domain-containing protein n=1 Tax=Bacillus sp. AFS051223 TaxID=2034280 RepID=UPI000BFEA43B|nr:DUF3883 domain-containing protein [Bacillus sp. AFS051223]PHA06687.1 hypothetical protein COE65_25005 [Bacillus sp. AFS051223]
MQQPNNKKPEKHIFIKFNDFNENFPKVVSTIREHEITGVNNDGELIWGQLTSRNQAGISVKHKLEIEQQLKNNIPTKVVFYSRKAELLYEAELIEIFDRDYTGATHPDFVKLLPKYYQHLAGVTHITAKNPMIIYSYFRIKGLRPISLVNNINHIYHYDKQVPILDVKGMQALLYVSLDDQYENLITSEKLTDNNLEVEGKKLELNKDTDVSIGKKTKEKSSIRNRYGVKRNYAAEADAKGQIGNIAEELVLEYEKERLIKIGFAELAKKVVHKSVTDGDGLGYDILSYEADGTEKYIEVKGTISETNIPFPISSSEIQFSKEKQEAFYIYRVYGLRTATPQLKIYQGSISTQFNLEPINYLAELK